MVLVNIICCLDPHLFVETLKNLPESLEVRLARAIAQRRKGLGLTQAQLAEGLGVDTETLSRFERGKHLPSLRTLERLAELLNTPIGALLAPESSQPITDSIQACVWLSGLGPEDRAFAMDQLKRQADYLRLKRRNNSEDGSGLTHPAAPPTRTEFSGLGEG